MCMSSMQLSAVGGGGRGRGMSHTRSTCLTAWRALVAGHTNALSFIFLSESRARFKFVMLVLKGCPTKRQTGWGQFSEAVIIFFIKIKLFLLNILFCVKANIIFIRSNWCNEHEKKVPELVTNAACVCAHFQVFRHGPRTPADTYPKDPYGNETFYPFGWGQVTNVSAEQVVVKLLPKKKE